MSAERTSQKEGYAHEPAHIRNALHGVLEDPADGLGSLSVELELACPPFGDLPTSSDILAL